MIGVRVDKRASGRCGVVFFGCCPSSVPVSYFLLRFISFTFAFPIFLVSYVSDNNFFFTLSSFPSAVRGFIPVIPYSPLCHCFVCVFLVIF